MRILVTGGAGFIGSHLSQRLLHDGHAVVIVDNLSTGHRENVPPGAEFVVLDLTQLDFVKNLPGGRFDAVCHLAAQSSGEISGEDPVYDVQANALSTLLLSQWCAKNKIPRFLYASSMAVYGNPTRMPVSESTICNPLSFYGISKLASEHFLRLTVRDGVQSTSFRMFSVFGPGQNMDNLKQGMVSIFMAYMLQNSEVPVKGSLDRFRDFVYIDDVIEAWIRALERPRTPQPIYNIGSGSPTTVRQLLASLMKSLGRPSNYPIHEYAGSSADQFGLYADIQQATLDLDWKPSTTLAKGLETMSQWALALSRTA